MRQEALFYTEGIVSVLKKLKLGVLSAAGVAGVSRLVLNSKWRRERLLILCYHGISLRDEHEWDPALYMTQELLRKRFRVLKKSGCTVLPLSKAVTALYAGELPPRAVAITFDDGFFDFQARAVPVAQEFGFPVTVYWTTYYSTFNRPVFDPALNYILWKGRGRRLDLREASLESVEVTEQSRRSLSALLYQYVTREQFSGSEKDDFLQRLAGGLNVDYDEMRSLRMLHLMTPDESRAVAGTGLVEVELHTHRHRVSNEKQRLEQEIDDNRRIIAAVTPRPANHFCYPSGFFLPDFPKWLEELGVESATTCIAGLCTRADSRYLMPRLVDTSTLTEGEFSAWVSGTASLLPKRTYVMDERALLKDETLKAPI